MTADDYLRSVSFELRDLPWGQRRDLLTEIRTHLDELPAGTDLGRGWERPRNTPPTCARPQAWSAAAE